MLKQAVLCTALMGSSIAGIAAADSDTQTADFTHVFAAHEVPAVTTPPTALLAPILAWITHNFDLPAADMPAVELTSPAQIMALRYRGLLPANKNTESLLGANRSVVALYDLSRQVIYLPEGWTGESPAEQSILVHEMVHHLQHRAKIRFNCPEEREKLAYEAQELWLARFGTSLEQEFELDPFTRLVLVNCMR
jgi:hypothetical protein